VEGDIVVESGQMPARTAGACRRSAESAHEKFARSLPFPVGSRRRRRRFLPLLLLQARVVAANSVEKVRAARQRNSAAVRRAAWRGSARQPWCKASRCHRAREAA